MRRDPSSEGASQTGEKASWLVPEGLHSCGTAPDSHRTSLHTRHPGKPGTGKRSKEVLPNRHSPRAR